MIFIDKRYVTGSFLLSSVNNMIYGLISTIVYLCVSGLEKAYSCIDFTSELSCSHG